MFFAKIRPCGFVAAVGKTHGYAGLRGSALELGRETAAVGAACAAEENHGGLSAFDDVRQLGGGNGGECGGVFGKGLLLGGGGFGHGRVFCVWVEAV